MIQKQIKIKKFYTLFYKFICILLLITGCNKNNITNAPQTNHYSPTSTISDIFPSPSPSITAQVETSQPDISLTRTPIQQIRTIDGMVMIHIPAGSFQMGSTEEEINNAITLCTEHYGICNRWFYEQEGPAHQIILDEYWIDQTEVTNTQYRTCVEAGVCSPPQECKKGEPTYYDQDKSDHPVVCVTWEAAQAYCEWNGSRLPTEAEWEFAYRGEDRKIFAWGDQFDGSHLNYCDKTCSQPHKDERYDDGYPLTSPAGSFGSGMSWAGIFNMSGNVSEWVSDWFGHYSDTPLKNPTGPEQGSEKMIKGCSWYFHPTYCRGAFRGSVTPDRTFDYLGFRCANSQAPGN